MKKVLHIFKCAFPRELDLSLVQAMHKIYLAEMEILLISLERENALLRSHWMKNNYLCVKYLRIIFLHKNKIFIYHKMSAVSYTPTSAVNNQVITLTWTDNEGFIFLSSQIYYLVIGLSNFTNTGSDSNVITFVATAPSTDGNYGVRVQTADGVTYNKIASTPLYVCFVEGSEILCINDAGEEEYIKVEDMKPGMIVKTHIHGAKKLLAVDKRAYKNDKSVSQICKISGLPGQTKDLFLTGGHALLVNELTEEQQEKCKPYGTLERKIDDMQLLLSHINENAEKIDDEETRNVYHIVLENDNEKGQYGVYANGVLCETMSIDCYNDVNALLRVRPSNYIL
jgi:hypothetical protein